MDKVGNTTPGPPLEQIREQDYNISLQFKNLNGGLHTALKWIKKAVKLAF